MRALTAFMNGVTRLNDVIGRLVAYLVLAMFVLILLEVFLRYLFNSPTVWTNEFTQLLFGVYAVLSGGYLLAHKGHVNVDLLYSALGSRAQAFIDIVTSVLFFVFTFALVYFAIDMATESFERQETSYSAWNPPIWPVKACIAIGAILLMLQGVVKLLQDIAIAFNLGYYTPPASIESSGEQL